MLVESDGILIEEIKSLIRNAYNREKQPDLAVSGMRFEVILDANGNCIDVEMKDLKGIQLQEGKEYSVGLNSYISASYKFDHRDPGNTTYTTGAQALIEFIKDRKVINYAGVKRTSVRK